MLTFELSLKTQQFHGFWRKRNVVDSNKILQEIYFIFICFAISDTAALFKQCKRSERSRSEFVKTAVFLTAMFENGTVVHNLFLLSIFELPKLRMWPGFREQTVIAPYPRRLHT